MHKIVRLVYQDLVHGNSLKNGIQIRCLAQTTGPNSSSTMISQVEEAVREEVEREPVNFFDSRPFEKKTFTELFRAWTILKMTSFNPLVRHSEKAFLLGRRVMPRFLFESIMKRTFYGQFTAGKEVESSKATIDKLHDAGIKTMLMIPIENIFDDVEKDKEAIFRGNQTTVMECVDLIALLEPGGFAQIKITALEDVSFYKTLNEYLLDYETSHEEPGDWDVGRVARLVENEKFDDITFNDLSEEDNQRMRKMLERVNEICKSTRDKNVRIMIDAEQRYIQAALGYVTLIFQAIYNKEKCVVFNTYQCYRKDTLDRIQADYHLGQQLGFKIAGKFVRGAYMVEERRLAEENGYESPINDTYEKTSEKYHKCIDYVLPKIAKDECSIMFATHNEETVEYAVTEMTAHGIEQHDENLCFGQIYGMCDHVSFTLGRLGFQVYKSVPVGTIEDTLLYLTRRAAENNSVLTRTKTERNIIRSEIFNRVAGRTT